MLLLYLLFAFVTSDPLCGPRTTMFGPVLVLNNNYYAYDPRTYAGTNTTTITPTAYREEIKKTLPCTGTWCIDDQWKCIYSDNARTNDCYHVEHIIPRANNITELRGCSVDIRGNMIMSYGRWNIALGNSYYGEKSEVYGESWVKSAYTSVYTACHGNPPIKYPDELCVNRFTPTYIIIFVAVALFGAIIAYTIIKYRRADVSE